MTGPCLCGDPHCQSCGNPAAAKYADWCDSFLDKLMDLALEEDESTLLEGHLEAFIEKSLPAYRKARGMALDAVAAEGAEYVNYLEDRVKELTTALNIRAEGGTK